MGGGCRQDPSHVCVCVCGCVCVGVDRTCRMWEWNVDQTHPVLEGDVVKTHPCVVGLRCCQDPPCKHCAGRSLEGDEEFKLL